MKMRSAMWLTLAALAVSCVGQSTSPSSVQTSGAAPSVFEITPTSGTVGTLITIRGSGFAATNNVVRFGRGYLRNLDSPGGTTLSFTVPDGLELCAPDAVGPCPGAYPPVTPGDYAVAVMSQGTTSNSLAFTVVARSPSE